MVAAGSGDTTCTNTESCITLADGGVRNEALAVLYSVGSTPLLGPDQPFAVSAVLFAPQVMILTAFLRVPQSLYVEPRKPEPLHVFSSVVRIRAFHV